MIILNPVNETLLKDSEIKACEKVVDIFNNIFSLTIESGVLIESTQSAFVGHDDL